MRPWGKDPTITMCKNNTRYFEQKEARVLKTEYNETGEGWKRFLVRAVSICKICGEEDISFTWYNSDGSIGPEFEDRRMS